MWISVFCVRVLVCVHARRVGVRALLRVIIVHVRVSEGLRNKRLHKLGVT